MIERRARQPGANLYLVSDAGGRIIAGNVRDLDRDLLREDGWLIPPFSYQRFGDRDRDGQAIAKVFSLPGGLRLLVGRDIGDAERFRQIVGRASTLSLVVMVLTADWYCGSSLGGAHSNTSIPSRNPVNALLLAIFPNVCRFRVRR